MMFRAAFLLLALLAVATVPATVPAADPAARKGKANRLAKTSSPYLIQHAHNPVDWYPWGDEAFAKAKKENKLVFLSIGYSACHWCHVMESESFSNKEVANYLNKHFVCIKVDREERPDVDQIYMAALNALGENGGWPLSMFLDVKGRPIIGGTYWPREDKEVGGEKMKGFLTILKDLQADYEKRPKAFEEQAEKLAKATAANLSGLSRGVSLVELDKTLVDGVGGALREGFDKVHGGFGSAERKFRGPKFPKPSTLAFLQGQAKRAKDKEAGDLVSTTLERMAMGGIYDHLGGGFARYTVERTWTIPHFEKMLYDNAQLLEVYAEAYTMAKRPLYARVLRQTVGFVAREMTSPEGAFYSALDADSEGEEGKFYIWTAKQLAELIPDKADLKLFRKVYGADDGFNFEGRYHILRLSETPEKLAREAKLSEEKLDEKLGTMRQKLFDARAKRPRPFLDTKVLTAWNGQMIAGLARAGQALDDKPTIERAAKAADFILKTMRNKDGRLTRSYSAVPGEKPAARFNAYLDDYAFLVHGLLTLHDATGEKRWLTESVSLTTFQTNKSIG